VIDLLSDGLAHVRIYDHMSSPDVLGVTTTMSYKRWYPTSTLLSNHKVLIYGGSELVLLQQTPRFG
jgi:hypothetical protein